MMFLVLLLTLCGSFGGFLANAQEPGSVLLAAEPFNEGVTSLNGANGGTGWLGGWQVQNGDVTVPGYNISGATPLVYSGLSESPGYAIGGIGWQSSGRLLDTGASGVFSPYLENGLIGRTGQTLWFSLLMRRDIDTGDTSSVTLHAGNPPWWVNAPGISVGYFGSGSDSAGTRYWSLNVDNVIHRSAVPVIAGQAVFLTVQIAFGATSTVSLYVNPPLNALPAAPGAQAITSNPVGFQSVAFYGGSGTRETSIDGLRFASSYAALIDGTAPPPAAPSNFSATPGDGNATLSWSAVSGATSYSVYRIVGGVAQREATTTGTSLVDGGLANGTAYTFYVVATNSTGASAPSSQVTVVPRGPAPAPVPALGTNLTQLADYNRAWPFVDAFKTARPWISQAQGSSWGQGPPLQLDSNGWIASLQPGQYAETIMFDNALDDQPSFPKGQYTLLYDGSGTLAFDLQSATIVSQTPGRMVVDVQGGQNGIYLIETATDPANPIRNIRFILPGFESTYRTQPFHPLFLQRLQPYKVLRFMEWMWTNGSAMENWSDRPTPSDYTYSWRGVPLEVMIQLVNQLGVKPWFNIPARATDDFMRQFAAVIGGSLDLSLSFFLEYSNETWNSMFSQHAYVESQGLALGLSADPTLAAAYYTAYRSVQMFRIFQSVLGSSSRMTRILASQAENSWLSDRTLGFQNAFASADALAIAPYFNCSDAATGGFGVLGDPATADQVSQMTVDQVDDIQLAHINGCARQEMISSSSVASKYGLKMIGYEGGQSLVGYNGAENNIALTALFKAVNQGSRMASLYAQYFANWVAAGGDLFVHYSDMGAYARLGNFGTLEYQDQDPSTSPKYQAMTAFAAQHP
ncbi:MAG TPA: hypothetical protein VHB50_21565 [Bryobacteraceae bacterium]|nr:hypothetical protein [Bryobacteraceae bacterium]